MGLLHIATCSGPARTAERALPCGCRVKSCARIAAWLKFFRLRVGLVCPAFALLLGRTLCFRRVLYVGITWFFRRCGLSQLADTLDKVRSSWTATQSILLVTFWLLDSVIVFAKHVMYTEGSYSYTGNNVRLPAAHSDSFQEVSLVTACVRQQQRDFDGRLCPAVLLSCHRSRRRFLPIVSGGVMRHEPRPRCSFRRLWHWREHGLPDRFWSTTVRSGSFSLAVTLIFTKEVRVLPPLFLQHRSCQLTHYAVSIGFWCDLLVLEPCSLTSSVALSVLGVVSRTAVWGSTAEPRRSNARRWVVRLARCVCTLVLSWVSCCSSAVPPRWFRCLVCTTYPIRSRSHPYAVVRGSQWPTQLLERHTKKATWRVPITERLHPMFTVCFISPRFPDLLCLSHTSPQILECLLFPPDLLEKRRNNWLMAPWDSPARSGGLLPAMCFAWSFSSSYPSYSGAACRVCCHRPRMWWDFPQTDACHLDRTYICFQNILSQDAIKRWLILLLYEEPFCEQNWV